MGDVEKGKKLFTQKCTQCHTINEGGPAKQGPNLFNIVGRAAGTIDGFSYTDANKNSGITWTEDVLLQYLVNPKKYIKGTRMNFPGFKKEQDRLDVVAFLKANSK